MYDIFFTFHSLTRAQLAVQTLRYQGISAYLIHAPEVLSAFGCGYAVKINGADGYTASAYLRNNHIVFEKAFRKFPGSVPEEVFV